MSRGSPVSRSSGGGRPSASSEHFMRSRNASCAYARHGAVTVVATASPLSRSPPRADTPRFPGAGGSSPGRSRTNRKDAWRGVGMQRLPEVARAAPAPRGRRGGVPQAGVTRRVIGRAGRRARSGVAAGPVRTGGGWPAGRAPGKSAWLQPIKIHWSSCRAERRWDVDTRKSAERKGQGRDPALIFLVFLPGDKKTVGWGRGGGVG